LAGVNDDFMVKDSVIIANEATPLFGGNIEIAHGNNGVISSYYLAQ
jgi:hypothetical protein